MGPAPHPGKLALCNRAARPLTFIVEERAWVRDALTADRLSATGVTVTRLAHGLPVGGELNYLDDGTLGAAFEARRPMQTTAAV